MSRRNDHHERGAATVFAVSLVVVLLLLGMAAVFVTATAAAHRRAQAGADLAALAGAAALQSGTDPCAEAATIAAENGVRLSACGVEGMDVLVTALLDGPEFAGHSFEVRGTARAGPG